MKQLFLLVAILLPSLLWSQKEYRISSPDHRLNLKVSVGTSVSYSLSFDGKTIISPSLVNLTVDNKSLCSSPKVKDSKKRSFAEELHPVYGKFKLLQNKFNELTINFEGNFTMTFRMYNEGFAYRFKTNMDNEIIINSEESNFCLDGAYSVLIPETEVLTAWELSYKNYNHISDIPDNKRAITPSLFSSSDSKLRVVIAESDVRDYPGMYIQKTSGVLNGFWAAYPAKTEMGSWGKFVSVVKEREKYIAKTTGTREFPWRVVIVTDDDKTLLTNELIYKLASPQSFKETDWIKPGKAAWEWWHDAIVEDAGFPTGMDNRNTRLYEHYIDFAAANHLEYLMIDAGWSNVYDVTKVQPWIDIQGIINHGKSKGVGVFLWCVAAILDKNLESNLDLIKSWGAVGIKVDFFDRDDQLEIRLVEKIAKAAAERHLMVNLHGCSKPTGLQRTYPNIVNIEAVRGNECSKWDLTANPDYHLQLPFVRMLAGGMDYTPGSMRNESRATFKPIAEGLPSTQGTRCHELAIFVVFDQPFAMLCDAPAEYRKYPDVMRFLSCVPTSFDSTVIVDAKLGEYAVTAKKRGNDWYIGGMSGWTAHDLSFKLSFLDKGLDYVAEIYKDGLDAEVNAKSYIYDTISVSKQSELNFHLASGGGFVIRIYPKNQSSVKL
jgi:alpha-glucosidase